LEDAKPIIVLGGGGHAKVVICILKKLGDYRVVGYTDSQSKGTICGAGYLGDDKAAESLMKKWPGLVAVLGVGQIGSGARRQNLWTRMSALHLKFPAVVSPNAVVNEGVTVGEATVVMDGAVINCQATLGKGVIANTNCTIEHDAMISDWVHVAPGATLSGGVVIGPYSMMGAGATVIEGISIAEGCVIGAGAVVTKDLREPGVYVGCPARRVK
jgi:sugar O-acyltransferase (sialic acid O-acetyltransferase NeuD family)